MKLTIVCMVTVLVALIIVASSLYAYEIHQLERQVTREFEIMAQTVAPLCAPSLEFGLTDDTKEITDTLFNNPEIVGVAVFDAITGDRVVESTRPRYSVDRLPATVADIRSGSQGADLVIAQPIKDPAGLVVGTLLIVGQSVEAQVMAFNYFLVCSGVLAVGLLVAFIMSSWLVTIISQPMVDLADTTRRVSVEGNYSLRAVKTSEDELGHLIDSFNHMLSIIQARDTELEQHRGRLEEEVAAQTQDLRKLSVAVEQSPNGIVITNPKGIVEYANTRCEKITGYTMEDAQKLGGEVLTFGAMDKEEAGSIRAELDGHKPCHVEFENRRKDGTVYWEALTVSPLHADDDGMTDYYVWLKEDITSRKHAEIALRESEERYALASAGANDGLWDWDLRTDEVYYSDRWATMLGLNPSDLSKSADEWFSRVHDDEIEYVRAAIDEHLRGETPHVELEFRIRHKDGTWRWILNRGVAVRHENGMAYRMAGSQTDITDRKLAETKLYYEASHDTLTNLPNRGLFTERLTGAIERSRRNPDALFSVLFLDLDRFKVINDSLGHLMGDELLVQVSDRLTQCVRTVDVIARLGGDEFAILLEDIQDEKFAIVVAERIETSLAQPFHLGEHEVYTSASVGIAYSHQGYERADDILRDSDSAMYRAKSLGKSQYALFDSELHDQAVHRLELENDMRRAMDNDEFELYYQPIVLIATEKVVGFEALVRWHHPQKGIVSPAEFIPVSEETGLIVPLSWKIMELACKQARLWHAQYGDAYDLSISVNLSSKQFMQGDFVPRLRDILEEHNVPPKWIKLEITETVIIENPTSVAQTLEELRALDLELCIDDFGTGYSSLSYLHQLPFDIVKIDRAFIKDMTENHETLEIVQAIVSLCMNLGLRNTAEGVEEESQLELLRALQCDYAQGYLIAKPMSVAEVPAFLDQSERFGFATKSA